MCHLKTQVKYRNKEITCQWADYQQNSKWGGYKQVEQTPSSPKDKMLNFKAICVLPSNI